VALRGIVDRMLGIYGHAVGAYTRIESSAFDHALFAVVAGMAERLNCAQSKLIPVAAMWFDVIDDGCDRDIAAGST